MNTKQKFTKWASITFVVALASLAFAGLVLAEHEIPFAGASSSWASFQQYNTALDEHTAELTADIRLNSWARTQEYIDALDRVRATRSLNSWSDFQQYNASLDQATLVQTTGLDMGRAL